MPWDSTELWVADLVGTGAGCRLEGAHRMAGRRGESLVQPAWAPDGSLYVVSDRSDWWNVYRVDAIDALSAVHGVDSEVGRPEWWFGQSRHAVADDGTVWLTVSDAAGARLGGVEPGRRECSSHCCGRRAVVVVRGWRLAIAGGSAGGFTVLAALVMRNTFAAGASHHGVAYLGAMARDTHKFESRYLDGLIGR